MTNVAAIFHWSLADMEAMPLAELATWSERAVSWFNHAHGAKSK